jgi:hypothetical protein
MVPAPGSGPQYGLWQGRRGLINQALALVVGFCGALAIAQVAEHDVAAPACRAYAADHSLTYSGIDVHSLRRNQPGPHCLFADAEGNESSVWLLRIVPFGTDLWVSLAMDLEVSAPALAVLLALVAMGLDRARSAHLHQGQAP